MRPARFEYVQPRGLAEAITLLSEEPEATVLAGGQSLVPLLSTRRLAPSVVVDINNVGVLKECASQPDLLQLGALTRHRWLELSGETIQTAPILGLAASLIGDPSIRRRGTLGGSLAAALPAAHLPVAVVLADAQLELESVTGHRTVRAEDFFLGHGLTALDRAELIRAVRVRPAETLVADAIWEHRGASGGLSVVTAARLSFDEERRCVNARIVVSTSGPLLLHRAPALLVEDGWRSANLLRTAASEARAEVIEADSTVEVEDWPLIEHGVATVVSQAWCDALSGHL